MAMISVKELFEHELKDIYYAEQHLEKALATLEKESENEELKEAFAKHRKETVGHVKRLDQVFKAISVKAQGKKCEGILGLLEEKKEFAKEHPSPEILDAFNMGAAMKTERYEITAYESLIHMAEQLGLDEVKNLLEQNLEEEEAALAKLKDLVEDSNPVAMMDA